MNAFEFQTVPQLIVEFGAAARLGQILRFRYKARRLCIVTDGFLLESGLLDPALASLTSSQWDVCIVSDVIADPPESVVLEAVSRARAHRAEVIVGLGGGSSMDVAKLLAVLLASDQPLSEMYGIGKIEGQRLPLIQIPTTAGTGSEVTGISIVTTGAATKAGVVASQLYADLAVLDAQLTMGLPPEATAATGIDAMVHAIEAYTTKHKKNPLSDAFARQALVFLSGNLLEACQNGNNQEARKNMLLGATFAGLAFANAPVAAVHALAYPLGGKFHVPHGLSNALVLPHVLRFNASAAADHYAELASIVIPNLEGTIVQRVDAFIKWSESLAPKCGIPSRLRDVGVKKTDLEILSEHAMQQTRLLINNPKPLGKSDAYAIYSAAL